MIEGAQADCPQSRFGHLSDQYIGSRFACGVEIFRIERSILGQRLARAEAAAIDLGAAAKQQTACRRALFNRENNVERALRVDVPGLAYIPVGL